MSRLHKAMLSAVLLKKFDETGSQQWGKTKRLKNVDK
jgi:hypothetical protein